MVTRRQGREWALQMLCQLDMNPPKFLEEDNFLDFWSMIAEEESRAISEGEIGVQPLLTASDKGSLKRIPVIREFSEERVKGVWNSIKEIDEAIAPFLSNWSLYRLGMIERNAIRLGVWEMLNCENLANAIIINEAVDITKFFSNTSSGRFVNGVLDNFAKSLPPKKNTTPRKSPKKSS
jgi:transcription antitermination factor NusB